MRNRRLRQYAMTEIENKRSGRKCRQNPIDRAVERFPSREERQGIEIALNRSELLDLFARKLRLNHPIEPNGIHRNSFDIGQELGAGAAGEADDFCIRNLFSNRVSNPSARRDTPFAEFIGRQYSGPGIENLHGIDAGLELPNQVTCRGFDQEFDQLREFLGIAVGEPASRRKSS